MPDFYESLTKSLIPFLASKSTVPKVRLEEWPFRLHFRVTTIILLSFTVLLCMREYIGENIKCSPNHDDDGIDPVVPKKLMETYCFIQTTFTTPPNYANSDSRILVRDTLLGGPAYIEGKSDKIHHAYYQWVPFFLFFLAFVFYAPHLIWKSIDNHKIQHLVHNLNGREILSVKMGKQRESKVNSLATYIIQCKGTNGYWAFCFVLYEFSNLAVVVSTMYLTDLFLGKEFSTYGPRVIQFLEQDPENRIDPMAVVFPRVTKCLFHTYGPSGTVQRLDALCILPSNILNEKIFTFLWFWFVLLAAITSLALIYRIATLFSGRLRYNALKIESFPANSQAVSVLRKLGLSEWFLLQLLRLNLDQATFHLLIEQMYEVLV